MLGGTFNPPHNGHLRILEAAKEAAGADEALMIPAFTPPHKPSDELVSARDRFNMCELCAGEIGAGACDLELIRGGRSYTVDTLLSLKEQVGKSVLYLVMGADMLVTLKTWCRYEEIIMLSEIIAFVRDDVSDKKFYDSAEDVRRDGGRVTLLPLAADGISSTMIRQRIKSGESVAGLVPDSVAEYIKKNKLYL